MRFKSYIYENILGSMCAILKAMETFKIPFSDQQLKKEAEIVQMSMTQTTAQLETLTGDVADAIQRLWADEGVQRCFRRGGKEYQLIDSAKYFFDHLDRVRAKNYVPTTEDVLRVRSTTTGIVQIGIEFKSLHIRVFDVGGQRSERKKWIHCFDDVNAVLFVAALSAYDQKLIEDDTTNRMKEAVRLFASICNSDYFIGASILLFLNKIDIFREKIKTTPLSVCFASYSGAHDEMSALDFIQQAFLVANQNQEKSIYVHRTCATDTKQVKVIIQASLDLVVEKNLLRTGIA